MSKQHLNRNLSARAKMMRGEVFEGTAEINAGWRGGKEVVVALREFGIDSAYRELTERGYCTMALRGQVTAGIGRIDARHFLDA